MRHRQKLNQSKRREILRDPAGIHSTISCTCTCIAVENIAPIEIYIAPLGDKTHQMTDSYLVPRPFSRKWSMATRPVHRITCFLHPSLCRYNTSILLGERDTCRKQLTRCPLNRLEPPIVRQQIYRPTVYYDCSLLYITRAWCRI